MTHALLDSAFKRIVARYMTFDNVVQTLINHFKGQAIRAAARQRLVAESGAGVRN